jgi:hypothetical protein
LTIFVDSQKSDSDRHSGQSANTQKKSEFVLAGIGNPSIRDDVHAQACWQSKGLRMGPGYGKATDSRDTEGTPIRRAAEFGEAIFTEKRTQSIQGSAHLPKLLQGTVIAKWRWQASWTSTIRRSAELSQADKSANLKSDPIPLSTG